MTPQEETERRYAIQNDSLVARLAKEYGPGSFVVGLATTAFLSIMFYTFQGR